MRHRKRTAKLGRTSEHRNLMLSNMVCSLILHGRVTTTLAKARAARSVAEKMVTLGKRGSLHDRRLAISRLHQADAVHFLFEEIAPQHKERPGGYTRIIKKHQRQGDAADVAILEWVTEALPQDPKKAKKAKATKPAEDKAPAETETPRKDEATEGTAESKATTPGAAETEVKAEEIQPESAAEDKGEDADSDKSKA